MAIKFDAHVNEQKQKELQEQENQLAKEENRKAKRVKRISDKTPFEKWSNLLLTLSIIALVYAISYSFSGLIILIPALLLWLAWFVVAVLPTICTVGTIWLSDGFKNFINGFTNFNSGISGGSTVVAEFMYKIFPFVASFFALCVICYLILKIIGAKKQIDKSFKGKLVWSIMLTVLFIIAIIFDIITFTTTVL